MGQLVDMTGNNQVTSIGGSGAGLGAMADSGNIYRDVQSSAQNPGTLAADKIMAIYTLPAGALDASGRGINITAAGSFLSSANAKTCKIIVNPTTPTLGATVSGGTTIATTGSWTTSTGGGTQGWQISANLFKNGSFGSNSQLAVHETAIMGVNVGALTGPQATSFTESSPMTIVITCNVATTATDLGYWFTQIQAYN